MFIVGGVNVTYSCGRNPEKQQAHGMGVQNLSF